MQVMMDLKFLKSSFPAVTRSALLNAASISGLFITTEAAVAEIPSKEPAMPATPEY